MRVEQVHVDQFQQELFVLSFFQGTSTVTFLLVTELLVEARNLIVELLAFQAEQAKELFDADELLASDVLRWVYCATLVTLE